MLVLGRREGESIDVGGPCRIIVVRSEANQCRIGIEADKDVSIMRTELVQPHGQQPPSESE